MKTVSKIMGVFLVLTLALSLIGFRVEKVQAANQEWSKILNSQIQDKGRLLDNRDMLDISASPDGKNVFVARANAGRTTFRIMASGNGGSTFTPADADDGVAPFLALFTASGTDTEHVIRYVRVSPNFATDDTVFAASFANVFRSVDGGVNYTQLPTPGGATGVGAAGIYITGLDLAADTTGTGLAVVVGTANQGAGLSGSVYMWRDANPAWTDLVSGAGEIVAVKFSPSYKTDGTLFAVRSADQYGAGNTILRATVINIVANVPVPNWAGFILDSDPITAAAIGVVDAAGNDIPIVHIAVPSGFSMTTMDRMVYVGLNPELDGAATPDNTGAGDVFRVEGRTAPGFTTSRVWDLALNRDIYGIGIIGTGATATVLASGVLVDAGRLQVYRSSNTTADPPTWDFSTAAPTGVSRLVLLVDPAVATTKKVFAGGSGAEAAFCVSIDNGLNFQAWALINTTIVSIDDIAVSPNYSSDGTMFAITQAAATSSLWRTTDKGNNWRRVLVDVTGVNWIDVVKLSPTYATDKTIYAADLGNVNVWRSVDGGDSWLRVSAPIGVVMTSFAVQSAAVLYFGTSLGQVYRSANGGVLWTAAIGGAGSRPITDIIAFPSPSKEVLVASDDGKVNRSTDDGVSFRGEKTINGIVGAAGSITKIAVDAQYTAARNPLKYIYAANSGAVGIWRIRQGAEQWDVIDAAATIAAAAAPTALASAGGSALYCADTVADTWIHRSVDAYSVDPLPTWANITQINPNIASVNSFLPQGVGAVQGVFEGRPMLRDLEIAGKDIFVINANDNEAYNAGPPAKGLGIQMAIWQFTDNLATALTQNLPADKAMMTGNTVAMSWSRPSSPQSTSFNIELSTDAALKNPESAFTLNPVGTTAAPATAMLAVLGTPGTLVIPGVSGLISGATLAAGTTYYWRVRALGPGGEPSPWSTIRSFVTALAAPTLVGPMGSQMTGGTGASLKPVLQWQAVPGANRFELQVDTSASFFAPFVNLRDTNRLDTTSYQIDKALEYSTTYYWRVRAASFTALSDWSTVGSFTTMDKPTTPAPPITITQVPPPVLNIPAATTPSWVWVVIVIGAILVIVMLVLVVRTRRV